MTSSQELCTDFGREKSQTSIVLGPRVRWRMQPARKAATRLMARSPASISAGHVFCSNSCLNIHTYMHAHTYMHKVLKYC